MWALHIYFLMQSFAKAIFNNENTECFISTGDAKCYDCRIQKTGLTCTVNCNFPLKILCNLLLLVICVWETRPKIKLKRNQYIQITLSLNLSGHCKSHRLFRWNDWVVWTWMLKGSIKEEGPERIRRNTSTEMCHWM